MTKDMVGRNVWLRKLYPRRIGQGQKGPFSPRKEVWGIFFNPVESTTQSMADSQTGYKKVMSSKNAFTPAFNPVDGEWPKYLT
jgi:hypothetical protein